MTCSIYLDCFSYTSHINFQFWTDKLRIKIKEYSTSERIHYIKLLSNLCSVKWHAYVTFVWAVSECLRVVNFSYFSFPQIYMFLQRVIEKGFLEAAVCRCFTKLCVKICIIRSKTLVSEFLFLKKSVAQVILLSIFQSFC